MRCGKPFQKTSNDLDLNRGVSFVPILLHIDSQEIKHSHLEVYYLLKLDTWLLSFLILNQ